MMPGMSDRRDAPTSPGQYLGLGLALGVLAGLLWGAVEDGGTVATVLAWVATTAASVFTGIGVVGMGVRVGMLSVHRDVQQRR